MVASSNGAEYAARPMSPGERYFAFLDHVVPMNMMFVADLEVVLPADHVTRSWLEFSPRRALTRLRACDDLTVCDGPPSRDVETRAVPQSEWDAVLGELARDRLGPGCPMRCVYLWDGAAGRSRLVLVIHHAIADGRVCVQETQQFLRVLDGQQVPDDSELTVVLDSPRTWPWQRDRRAMLELLRDLAARQAGAAEIQPLTWERPTTRQPQLRSVVIDPPVASALFAGAKAHGTRAYSAIAAAWLVAAARTLGEGERPTFLLGTPADLNPPSPARYAAPAVSVIGTRHAVPDDPWQLAPAIGEAIDDARSRGEDALFFNLTRADRIADVGAGAAAARHAVTTAPPSVSVTNLGIVDAGADPSWVGSICGFLATSPNQVLFVSGAGYRGKLVQSVSFDAGQLADEDAAGLVSGFRELVREMGAR